MSSWRAYLDLEIGVPSTGDQSLQVQVWQILPSSLRPTHSYLGTQSCSGSREQLTQNEGNNC